MCCECVANLLLMPVLVQDGQGKVLVLAVGMGSYQGKMQQKIKAEFLERRYP